MRNLLIAVLFILTIQLGNSQNMRIKFEHISLEQGLSQSSIRSIAQDKRGFLWFATLDGLNKYDGYFIKIYSYHENVKGALSDNVINVLFDASSETENSFWIGTDGNGLCKYNSVKDNFTTYQNAKKNPNSISNDKITSILGDNKTLWIGTADGLNKFDVQKETFKTFSKKNGAKLDDDYIKCIVAESNDNLWVATKMGLNKFDLKTEQFQPYTISVKFSFNSINTLFYDGYFSLWVGTDDGIVILDTRNGTTKQYKADGKPNSLSGDRVRAIVKDKDGIYWIGTDGGGLNRFDKAKQKFIAIKHDPSDLSCLSTDEILSVFQDRSGILWVGNSLGGINKWNRAAEDLQVFRRNPYDANSLNSNQVRCIYQDNFNNTWLGTVDGGLNKWDITKNRFVHYVHDPQNVNSISSNHVRSILKDSKGNFWIGTDGGGINRFDTVSHKFTRFVHDDKNPFSISENRVWKVIEDRKGNIWIATYGGGIERFDYQNNKFYHYRNDPQNSKSLSGDATTTIFEDRNGLLWVGTFAGLNQFDPTSGEFTRYIYDPNNSKSLSNNRVYMILEDTEGELWIGTKGGLCKFNRKTKDFERFTSENTDLPNNAIMGILDDGVGNLWVSTNRGISKFNRQTHKVRTYDVRDGLQSNEFLAGSCFKTKQNEFIFGGINGFNAFFPANIQDNQNIPELVITGFKVSNNDLELDSTITEKKIIELEHTQTDLTFDFVALDYIFPEKNQYAYQLVGYDKTWQYVKFARTAKYTNLPPKKYIFRVKGSNNDEVWNDKGTQIVVIIHPAFWQTTWFRVSSTIIILFIISLIIWLRFRAIKKRNEHLEELVSIRTAEVVKQKDEIELKNGVLVQQKEEITAQNEVLHQQKEEIEAQRDEIESQRDIATKQLDIITLQKKEITDSIQYAKRIQTAALPSSEALKQILPEYFVLFKPRDIVSGDFYWASKRNNKLVVTAADCTGHGVPGAFMSMLGMSFMNNIVNEEGITESDQILNYLRSSVIQSLHQRGVAFEAKDGMDISLCVIDLENKKISFSGGYNPLYLIRKGEAIIYKADDMPIAIYDLMNPFTKTEIDIQTGDVIYMFSDGYADQFGGEKGKKFMAKRFRELLTSIAEKPMFEQRDILDEAIENWRSFKSEQEPNGCEQVDDIVVFGIRL